MDLTKIKDMLIDPVSDKVAELLSPKIAQMVSDMLKQEILEAQKYRIDKEYELKEYEINSKYFDYCKVHKQFMKQVMLNDNEYAHYECQVDGCDRGYSYEYPTRKILSTGIEI